MADRYWQNREEEKEEPSIVEMLVDGDIEVVEIVRESVCRKDCGK